MIIEFFGAPGAGKTTNARFLAEKLGVPLVAKGGNHRIKDAFIYAFAHPCIAVFFVFIAISETIRTGTWALMRFRIAIIGSTFSIVREASRAPGAAIVDEGLVQRVLSVYERPLTPKSADRIIRFLSPDHVVIVSSVAGEFRRYEDPSHERRRLGDAYIEHWKSVVRHNVGAMRDAIERSSARWSHAGDDTATTFCGSLLSRIS